MYLKYHLVVEVADSPNWNNEFKKIQAQNTSYSYKLFFEKYLLEH